MNTKKIKWILVIAGILSIAVGTFFHFAYEWAGNNKIIAAFAPVNESVWEHLKLAFFPMLLFNGIGLILIGKKAHNRIEAWMIGIFVSLTTILVGFYTYSGMIGESVLAIDISLFIFAILLGEYVTYRILSTEEQSSIASKSISLLILLFLGFCFIAFTYFPPKVNLFRDPVTRGFGIEAHP